MGDFFPYYFFLLIALIVIVMVGAPLSLLAEHKALDAPYRRLAQRLGGRSSDGGMIGWPSLQFQHRGAWAKVDIHSTGGKNAMFYTQLHIAWPDRNTRCEIYPEYFLSRVGKLLGMTDVEIGAPFYERAFHYPGKGMTDVEIGAPNFDRDFIITGSSPQALRKLLTPEVQAAIYRLRRMRHNDHIYLSIGGGQMLVKKLGLIRKEHLLAEFVEVALDLYDRAAIGAAGIEIVEQAPLAEATEKICQVCGEPIVKQLVYCRRCKTHHHEDCWHYFGGCSTFGCGEKRFVGKG